MDGRKTHLLRLSDIGQRVVDEQTFTSRSSNFIKQDLEYFGIWLDVAYIARNDEVIK